MSVTPNTDFLTKSEALCTKKGNPIGWLFIGYTFFWFTWAGPTAFSWWDQSHSWESSIVYFGSLVLTVGMFLYFRLPGVMRAGPYLKPPPNLTKQLESIHLQLIDPRTGAIHPKLARKLFMTYNLHSSSVSGKVLHDCLVYGAALDLDRSLFWENIVTERILESAREVASKLPR